MNKLILPIPLFLGLISCTANQVYMERPDGSVRLAYNGGSVGSKSLNDTATMRFKDVVMERTVTGKDEVELGSKIIGAGIIKAGISAGTETTQAAISKIPSE